MDPVKTCSSVLESIRKTNLNFVFSESPFGVNISIKKSLRKHKRQDGDVLNNLVDFGDDIEVFKELNVKLKKDSLVKDNKIQDLTYKIGALRNELKDSVTQVEDYRLSEKKYEKKIKEKDKDIYDIKKDLVKATEDHVADSKEISELKCKVNQEKKEKNKLQKERI